MFSRFKAAQEADTVMTLRGASSITEAEGRKFSPQPVFDPVELYLFQVEANLLALAPETRQAILAEIRQHLHASVSARRELGMPQAAAAEEAIERFGHPEHIARQFCRVWRKEESTFPRAAFSHALIVFVGCGAAIGIPAALNMAFPESGIVSGLNLWVAALLYPVLAGFWVGCRAPRRAALGTLLALTVLLLGSLPLTGWNVIDLRLHSGSQWLTPGFIPLIFLLWLLPGCLSASITARLGDASKRRKTVQ